MDSTRVNMFLNYSKTIAGVAIVMLAIAAIASLTIAIPAMSFE